MGSFLDWGDTDVQHPNAFPRGKESSTASEGTCASPGDVGTVTMKSCPGHGHRGGSDGSACSRSSPSNGTFPVLSRQLCFPGSLSPTSKSMTRQSEPLTWRYKLPLIIPAARQALGAPSWEQLCPLTPLHFSCFKGFSPHPSLKFPCLVDPGSFLFPPSHPGTSGASMARAQEGGEPDH